jgi:hypothetical protein
VLEEMGEAGESGLLVLGPNIVLDFDPYEGYGMVLG